MKEQETMNLPEGYKMTELGPLPEDWEVVKLGEVANLIRGISWGKKDEDPNGTPVIAIPNVHKGRISFDIRYKIAKSISDSKKLNEGDILLVGSSGSVHNVGRTAVVEGLPFKEATFASFLIKAIPVSTIDKQFLFYLFESPIVDFASCSKRAADGKYNLQLRQLSEHKIPLPPLSEQKKIATVLSAVQEAKEKTEEVIKATKELKKSLMKYLFTYGPVPVEEAEKITLKETEIGEIPEEWEVSTIGNLTKTYSGGTPNRKNKNYWNGTIAWAKSGELKDSEVYEVEEKITDAGLNNSSAKFVDEGYLLVAMYGATAGKVGIAKFKFTINQAICAIVPNEYFNSKFYFYYLIHIRDNLLAQRFGGAQPNLNQQIIKNIKVPKVRMPIQQAIASILSAVDEKIQAEENKKKALEDLFKTLLHDLMTAKIRVNHLEVEA